MFTTDTGFDIYLYILYIYIYINIYIGPDEYLCREQICRQENLKWVIRSILFYLRSFFTVDHSSSWCDNLGPVYIYIYIYPPFSDDDPERTRNETA